MATSLSRLDFETSVLLNLSQQDWDKLFIDLQQEIDDSKGEEILFIFYVSGHGLMKNGL